MSEDRPDRRRLMALPVILGITFGLIVLNSAGMSASETSRAALVGCLIGMPLAVVMRYADHRAFSGSRSAVHSDRLQTGLMLLGIGSAPLLAKLLSDAATVATLSAAGSLVVAATLLYGFSPNRP